MPVQPESTGSSARYSCAASPTEAALTRSGRSLLTRTTSSPSAARLHATDRIRVSLSPSRNPAGSTCGSEWLSSTRTVPPSVADRQFGVQPAVLDPQVIEVPQGLAGEVAQFGMVPLGFQLGDDDDRQDHLCSSNRVIAAGSASRTLVSSTYVRRPWELATQTPLGAGASPAPGQDTDVSDGPGLAPKGPRRPFCHLACTQSAKLGDSRAFPGTAPRRPPLQKVPVIVLRQKHRRVTNRQSCA